MYLRNRLTGSDSLRDPREISYDTIHHNVMEHWDRAVPAQGRSYLMNYPSSARVLPLIPRRAGGRPRSSPRAVGSGGASALLWNLVYGWQCFGVSKWMAVFRNMDDSVAVFRVVFPESVSKWMVVFRCFQTVFRSGWWCFEMDGNVGAVSSKSVSK